MHRAPRHLRPLPGGRGGDEPPPRRGGWRDFRQEHPALLVLLLLAIAALLAANGWLWQKRRAYLDEAARMRAGLSQVERRQADAVLTRNESRMERLRLELALLRRQALTDEHLHLTVSLDSALMRLERDGAVLREMPVHVGPERRVGTGSDTVRLAAPRGSRTVERVLLADSAWEVPAWVYAERGLQPPADRVLKGALGPAAIVLSGGSVIYAVPSVGPLNDSGYVLPGAVRARGDDLRAVAPNLRPGMTVYLY